MLPLRAKARVLGPKKAVQPGPAARHVVNATDTSAGSSVPAFSLGIDLGTTNSVAAVVSELQREPVLVPLDHDGWTLPSVVAYKSEGEVLVGHKAKRQAALNPKNTYYSVKRVIGRKFEDVCQDAGNLAYDVQADEYGSAVLTCSHLEEALLPEEVSAQVLMAMLEKVEEFTGEAVDRAVLSVPAYFDEEQREATIAAGKMAGLSNVKLIKEPVASAFSFGLDLNEDKTVLVFDLGGGTFDVSILEVGNGVIEVLATGGDRFLGGDDWDLAIMRWIDETHLKPYGVDSSDARIRTNLRAIAESAKVKLSSAEKVELRLPVGGPDGAGVSFTMTSKLLDDLAADLYRRCRQPVDQACWQAGVDLGTILEAHDRELARYRSARASKRGDEPSVKITPKRRQPISEVLLVGGATRMPSIRNFVKNMTGLEPRTGLVDPDAAVASGAAIYAGVLSGHIEDLMIMDVWQASLLRALMSQKLKEDPEVRRQFAESDSDFDYEYDSESDGAEVPAA